MTDHKARVRRLADRIQIVVAEILERRVKDPRLGFITLTDVRVTNDLREASIFYTVLGDSADRDDTAAALSSAKGMIRSEMGQALGVKFTPSIEFIADAIPENAAHIDELLKQAAVSDARIAEQSAAADFAGGADPYRAEDDPDVEPVE